MGLTIKGHGLLVGWKEKNMSDLWKYTEECDGDYCPMNCDKCNREEDDDDCGVLPVRQIRKDGADILS